MPAFIIKAIVVNPITETYFALGYIDDANYAYIIVCDTTNLVIYDRYDFVLRYDKNIRMSVNNKYYHAICNVIHTFRILGGQNGDIHGQTDIVTIKSYIDLFRYLITNDSGNIVVRHNNGNNIGNEIDNGRTNTDFMPAFKEIQNEYFEIHNYIYNIFMFRTIYNSDFPMNMQNNRYYKCIHGENDDFPISDANEFIVTDCKFLSIKYVRLYMLNDGTNNYLIYCQCIFTKQHFIIESKPDNINTFAKKYENFNYSSKQSLNRAPIIKDFMPTSQIIFIEDYLQQTSKYVDGTEEYIYGCCEFKYMYSKNYGRNNILMNVANFRRLSAEEIEEQEFDVFDPVARTKINLDLLQTHFILASGPDFSFIFAIVRDLLIKN
jgi:hypothetical protein